jgi:SAM-dependent MidA family methyltransferase
MGTIMCHYRHHLHADALWLPGLNDVTAHVDFTAMADAAAAAGLQIMGYTTQAHFLLNCGLVGRLTDTPSPAESSAVQRLISEAEMGELFKVLALARGISHRCSASHVETALRDFESSWRGGAAMKDAGPRRLVHR